jgi:hypothetical protein
MSDRRSQVIADSAVENQVSAAKQAVANKSVARPDAALVLSQSKHEHYFAGDKCRYFLDSPRDSFNAQKITVASLVVLRLVDQIQFVTSHRQGNNARVDPSSLADVYNALA